MNYTLHHGNCLDVLHGMADASVDSIVTDPPYGLSDHKPTEVVACLSAWIAGEPYTPKGKGFMGKGWDAWVPGPEVWRECLRVLKPGGHLLAFAGTRSMDLICMAVRLAGFELRDSIGYASDGGDATQAPVMAWTFGSGFPKSMDVSKAIDKAAGVRGHDSTRFNAVGQQGERTTGGDKFRSDHPDYVRPEGITEAAKQWQGWGTALKPAWEPIILARKPLAGAVAANVAAHGTGGLNIEACRVGTESTLRIKAGGSNQFPHEDDAWAPKTVQVGSDSGRWPANLIHDGSPEVAALFPGDGDTGSAARFFYCAKASKRDRDDGLDGFAKRVAGCMNMRNDAHAHATGNTFAPKANTHPTVKPTDLMRYLCRLVTPPGGVVFDPFTGSGSTGKAAMLEGFRFIGVEREAEYIAIARARIEAMQPQLFGVAP